MFASPPIALIRRELLTALRTGRSFALLVLTVGAAFCFSLLFVLDAYNDYYLPVWAIQQIFITFSMVLFFAAGLFPLVIGAAGICVEKQRESYDLLATSLLRPAHIVLAKWVNAVGFFLLLFVATLPLVGVLFFFVGIDLWAYFRSMTVIFFTAGASAAIGLCASSLCRRPLIAIVASFFAALVFCGALTLVIMGVSYEIGYRSLADYLQRTPMVWSPIGAVALSWETGRGSSVTYWLLGLCYQVVWIVVCLKIAWRVTLHAEGALARLAVRAFPTARWILNAATAPPAHRVPIPDSVNAMYAKEMRTGFMARPRVAALTFGMALLASLCFDWYFLNDLNRRSYVDVQAHYVRMWVEETATLFYTESIVLLVLVPAMVAAVSVKDDEVGNTDLLRGTLLDPFEVIVGKLRAVFMSLVPWVAAFLCSVAYMLVCLYLHPDGVFGSAFPLYGSVVGGFFVSLLYVVALSFCCTLWCRRTVTAVVSAYLVNIAMLALLPLFCALIIETWNLRRVLPNSLDEMVFTWVSPVVAQAYNFDVQAWRSDPVNTYWLTNAVFFTGVSILLLYYGAKSYAARRWRDR